MAVEKDNQKKKKHKKSKNIEQTDNKDNQEWVFSKYKRFEQQKDSHFERLSSNLKFLQNIQITLNMIEKAWKKSADSKKQFDWVVKFFWFFIVQSGGS
jgi:hypothetical protein